MKAQLEDRHSGNGALYWGLAALIHIQWERWDQALQAQVQAMANYDDCPLRRDVGGRSSACCASRATP